MNWIIKELAEICYDNKYKWGNKAFNLSVAYNNNISVMPGYGISFYGDIGEICNVLSQSTFLNEINIIFKKLYRENALIVRSSADVEDEGKYKYPGVFESVGNIKSVNKLLQAIKKCIMSIGHAKVKDYKNINHINDNIKFFCILIQKQLNPVCAGVTFTNPPIYSYYLSNSIMTELVAGQNWNLMQGKERGNVYTINTQNSEIRLKCLSELNDIKNIDIETILKDLYKVVLKIIYVFGNNLDIEWGYEKEIVIFQVRLNNKEIYEYMDNTHQRFFLDKEKELNMGLKAVGMSFFKEHNMFSDDIYFFDKNVNTSEMINTIENSKTLGENLTVRFSYKKELGLPRYFSKKKKDAIEFLLANRRADWTVIVHNCIDIKSSYELYIDNEKAILEHVPGMWESDSKLNADFVLFNNSHMEFQRVKTERKSRFENYDGNKIISVLPLTRQQLVDKAKKVCRIIKKIENEISCYYPLNFHFVEDKNNKLFFLNIRLLSKIDKIYAPSNCLYKISNKNDLANWNGEDSLYLSLDIIRGEEGLLYDIIYDLKKINKPVYVEFGILSHPAIMLRESGIDVLPLFEQHDHFHINI